MTVTAKALIESAYAANSQTTQYTAPTGCRTIIDKLTASNNTAGAVTFAVNLVPSGGAAGASNLIYSASIAANTVAEITASEGHVLEAGDFISTLAGAASSIVIRASGREVTG